MLIVSYELELSVSTHSANDIEYDAIAHLAVDISPVLPYLNAILSRGVYMPTRPALSWRQEGRNIGFWPDRIAVDHLHSREEVDEVIGRMVQLVNETWARRGELVPDHTTHERLQPLEIQRLLPRTNCKRCGEMTCFNFSLKLAAGQVELRSCTPLYEGDQYDAQRKALERLLETKWSMT